MLTLTKENAKHHCRTCLKELGSDAKIEQSGEKAADYKELCINITSNTELQQLITKYVDQYGPSEPLEQLPKHICLCCYNKLNCFERFRRRIQQNTEKLLVLFNGFNGVTKVEIDYEDDEQQLAQRKQQTAETTTNNQDDIYKLLLKDTLMETESVILNASSVAVLTSVEMHDPDPFDVSTPCIKNTNEPCATQDDSEVESDWQQADAAASDSVSSTSDSSKVQLASLVTRKRNLDRKCRTIKIREKLTCNTNNIKSLRHSKFEEKEQSITTQEKPRATIHTRSKRLATQCTKNAKKHEKRKRRSKEELKELHAMQMDIVHRDIDADAETLDSKMRRRHKGTKNSFKCTQCNHCFAHKITLDAHVRKVHEGSKRPFQCDRCDKSYTFIGGLYTHIKEIHDAEVRSYSCDFPECGRIYTSFVAMQKHKRLKHTDTPSQKKYVCEQCGATFNQSGNLKYHRRTKHPTEAEQAEKERTQERFQCEVCQKLFHSRYTLKYHTLQLHTNETKYECTVCGRRMAKKFMLVQHMLVHSTEKMPCEHCGRQFIRKFELEAHIRAVHMKLKPFECQYCSECFASRKTLRHHEYIHTGEKPYVCDICGHAYRQQTCLKNHRKSHEKAHAQANTNAENLLVANINRTLMNTLLAPAQGSTGPGGLSLAATVAPAPVSVPVPTPANINALSMGMSDIPAQLIDAIRHGSSATNMANTGLDVISSTTLN